MKNIFKITLLLLIFFITIHELFAAKDIELEEKIISRLVESFFDACKKKNFNLAHSLTTGREQQIFSDILSQIKNKNGMTPSKIDKYFSRLSDFKVNIVQIDDSADKAIAICTYEFREYDSKSKDEIRKDREVLYYFLKVNDKWKIALSKMGNEKYYYRSKTRPNKIIGY